MTLHNALHTGSNAHLVVSALDARVDQSGMFARGGTGPLDVRLGVMWPSAGFAVTGTSSTSPWQYSVAGGTFLTSKGSLDGPRLSTNDATYLVSTIAPPASNSRYDVVYVMQQDADATINADGTTAPLIGVVNGAAAASPTIPTIPAGALQLAHFLIPSTATAGTSDAGITATIDFVWTTLRGLPIPVRNATEKNAVTWGTAAEPAVVFEIDTLTTEINTGSGWYVSSANVNSWNAYTPSLVNITLGTGGTVVGRWQQVGRTVTVFVEITFGSSGYSWSGPYVGLPSSPSPAGSYQTGSMLGTGLAYDTSASAWHPLLAVRSGSAALLVAADGSGSGLAVTASSPFALGAGDRADLQLIYEV